MPILNQKATSGGGSLPDPITTAVNIAPTSPTAVALTVTSGAAEADGADVFVVSNADTDLLVEFASDGTFFFTMQPDSAGFKINGTATSFVATRDNKLGFFGHAAAARPAAPVTLGDVIAALQALGLVAT